ncbi:hypothetical protein F511_28213 [Dorcoceras hygrometricum]|uniref:Uncharacterized protein n=1 Tax=Dorcoceras hygrometricum TaxID=472368 RepID=A0A2Z7BAA4_9LAMI|nr:hypothetical protein F511_28213 [Dorcoceras hygrometricum]
MAPNRRGRASKQVAEESGAENLDDDAVQPSRSEHATVFQTVSALSQEGNNLRRDRVRVPRVRIVLVEGVRGRVFYGQWEGSQRFLPSQQGQSGGASHRPFTPIKPHQRSGSTQSRGSYQRPGHS